MMPALLTSCFSYTTVVGNGGTGQNQVTKWNTYFVAGLIPGKITPAKELAGGSENYTVTTKHSFLNYLVSGITFNIYAPTTTIVTK